jgi:hypothetical protein
VVTKAKLEYQLENSGIGGFEEDSLSEISRWWLLTFLRPDAHLMLSHVDPWSGHLIQVEQRDLSAIMSSGVFKYKKKIILDSSKKKKIFHSAQRRIFR